MPASWFRVFAFRCLRHGKREYEHVRDGFGGRRRRIMAVRKLYSPKQFNARTAQGKHMVTVLSLSSESFHTVLAHPIKQKRHSSTQETSARHKKQQIIKESEIYMKSTRPFHSTAWNKKVCTITYRNIKLFSEGSEGVRKTFPQAQIRRFSSFVLD